MTYGPGLRGRTLMTCCPGASNTVSLTLFSLFHISYVGQMCGQSGKPEAIACVSIITHNHMPLQVL